MVIGPPHSQCFCQRPRACLSWDQSLTSTVIIETSNILTPSWIFLTVLNIDNTVLLSGASRSPWQILAGCPGASLEYSGNRVFLTLWPLGRASARKQSYQHISKMWNSLAWQGQRKLLHQWYSEVLENSKYFLLYCWLGQLSFGSIWIQHTGPHHGQIKRILLKLIPPPHPWTGWNVLTC